MADDFVGVGFMAANFMVANFLAADFAGVCLWATDFRA